MEKQIDKPPPKSSRLWMLIPGVIILVILTGFLWWQETTNENKNLPQAQTEGLSRVDKGSYRSLYLDESGEIWSLSQSSIVRYNNALNKAKEISLSKEVSNQMVKILLTKGNTIWGTTTNGGVLLKTGDEGKTWDCILPKDTKMVFCDRNIGDIDLGTISSLIFTNNTYFVGAHYGIFKSNDEGNTWQEVNTDKSQEATKSVRDLFTDGKNIYAFIEDGKNQFGLKEEKFLISKDSGNTWQESNTASDDTENQMHFAGLTKSGDLYAYSNSGNRKQNKREQKLWKYKNEKWEPVSNITPPDQGSSECGLSGEIHFAMNSKDEIWATCSIVTSEYKGGDFPTVEYKGGFLLKSTDKGANWEAIDIGKKVKYIHDIAFLSNDVLLIASPEGLYSWFR